MQLSTRKVLPANKRSTGKRRAGIADTQIGQQIRKARAARGLSQERLAELIGVSCQQLQKYEAGANRVSGSRVVQLSDILGVCVSFFLRGTNADVVNTTEAPVGPTSAEMLRLLSDYCRITNVDGRKQISDMAAFLANLK